MLRCAFLATVDVEQEDEAWASPAGVERRRAALQLLHPEGMGRRVLVLGRSFARSAPRS